eukprot:8618708-Pyramimonas_sp.AAC.1
MCGVLPPSGLRRSLVWKCLVGYAPPLAAPARGAVDPGSPSCGVGGACGEISGAPCLVRRGLRPVTGVNESLTSARTS